MAYRENTGMLGSPISKGPITTSGPQTAAIPMTRRLEGGADALIFPVDAVVKTLLVIGRFGATNEQEAVNALFDGTDVVLKRFIGTVLSIPATTPAGSPATTVVMSSEEKEKLLRSILTGESSVSVRKGVSVAGTFYTDPDVANCIAGRAGTAPVSSYTDYWYVIGKEKTIAPVRGEDLSDVLAAITPA